MAGNRQQGTVSTRRMGMSQMLGFDVPCQADGQAFVSRVLLTCEASGTISVGFSCSSACAPGVGPGLLAFQSASNRCNRSSSLQKQLRQEQEEQMRRLGVAHPTDLLTGGCGPVAGIVR